MTDSTGAAGGQEPTTTQPQAGDPKATQQAQAASADTEGTTVDAVALQRELAEARREAARYRTEAKALADAKKAADEASLPEKERYERRIVELERTKGDLERQVREIAVQQAITTTAGRLGFADPGDAFRLLDVSQLDLDDKGQPKDVEKALRGLLTAKPYLAASAARATGSIDQGARAVADTPQDMNQLLRAARGH